MCVRRKGHLLQDRFCAVITFSVKMRCVHFAMWWTLCVGQVFQCPQKTARAQSRVPQPHTVTKCGMAFQLPCSIPNCLVSLDVYSTVSGVAVNLQILSIVLCGTVCVYRNAIWNHKNDELYQTASNPWFSWSSEIFFKCLRTIALCFISIGK